MVYIQFQMKSLFPQNLKIRASTPSVTLSVLVFQTPTRKSHYSLLTAFSDSSGANSQNLLYRVNAITLDEKGEGKPVIEVRLSAQEQVVKSAVQHIKQKQILKHTTMGTHNVDMP